MKKTIPLDSRRAGALALVLALGLAVEVAKADFTFGEPVNLGPPFNSPSREVSFLMSADGLEVYVSSERSGGLGYIDMWCSTRENADNPWGPLVNVQEINSRYNESFPCLSADGLTLYFSDWYDGWNAADDRPGGVGRRDLWMCTRTSRNDPWGTPVNMGAPFNSGSTDMCPIISHDGLTFIFASRYRSGGLGNFDLWMSTRPTAEGDWAAPVNMGPAVNSSAYDGDGCLSTDGLALFFASDRSGGMGSYDIWMTTRPSQAAAWSPPVNLGPPINTSGMEGIPSLSPDQKTLYFGSDQSGGIGGWDVYEVPIVPTVDFNGDYKVDIEDLLILIEHWGQDEPSFDMGPMPWGDGVVDAADLEVLMSSWGQEIHDPHFLAHWKLDETEGDIAYDSAGVNDAILSGHPLWQPGQGIVDGALEFDGMDDMIMAEFVVNPDQGPFSVFAWIKGGAPGQVILSQQDGVNWLKVDTDGTLMTELTTSGGRRVGVPLYSETVVTDGNWHRIGFVWDGTQRILYVDDIPVALDSQSDLAGSTGGLIIGAGTENEADSFWSGMIDDVRIYDRVVEP